MISEVDLRHLEATYADPQAVRDLSPEAVSDDVIELVWEIRRLRAKVSDLEGRALLGADGGY